jgi:hypothetical protein
MPTPNDPPQRRRAADKTTAALAVRMEDVENELVALRALPDKVIALKEAVERMADIENQRAQDETNRLSELRADVSNLQEFAMQINRQNGLEHRLTRQVAAEAPVLTWTQVAKFVAGLAASVGVIVVPFLLVYLQSGR